MNKKTKDVYKKLATGELEKELKKLKEKVDNKSAKKEQYEEMQKLEKIIANKDKIKDTIEIKKELSQAARKIENVVYLRKRQEENSAKEVELDNQATELQSKKKEIADKIKSLSTSPEKNKEAIEKEKLKLSQITEELNDNNNKFMMIKSKQERLETVAENEYNKLSDEKLNELYNNIKNKENKCELALSTLLEGRDIETVQEKFKKFKNGTFDVYQGINKRTEKLKREKTEQGSEEIEIDENQEQNIERETEKALERYEEENKLKQNNKSVAITKTNEFAEKHPRIAKIINWIKGIGNKNKAKQEYDNEEKSNNSREKFAEKVKMSNKDRENGILNDKIIKDLISSKDEEFNKIFGEIVEKGIDKYQDEKSESLLQKQKEQKEEAMKRQNEKYGEDYSKNSGDEQEIG